MARLVKKTALTAGVRGELSEAERSQKFAGHSLRAGLASAAEVDERHVQKQLGHASAEMTRRYQRRRDRFRVNLTKGRRGPGGVSGQHRLMGTDATACHWFAGPRP